MVLRLIPNPNIFGSSSIFKVSPEDNQGLLFQGGRHIPGSVTGPAGDDGDDGTGFDFIEYDVFDALAYTNAWSSSASAGGSYSVGSGIISMNSGSDSGDYAALLGDTAVGLETAGYQVIEFSGRFNVTDTGDDAYIVIGIANANGNLPSDFIGLHMNDYTSGNQEIAVSLVTRKDSTSTVSSTTSLLTAVSGSGTNPFYTHRIEMSVDEVRWYVNGVLKATNTANIPDDINMKPLFRVESGGATEHLYLRNFSWWRERN